MKKSFFGYYPPTIDQYEKLWSDGLIVLDANVLLSLYRLPTTARDDLIKVLESLKERLWIPHQVAMEFQRNRLAVIANERKTTEDVLKELQELVACARSKVNSLELDKRNLSIEPKPLLDELEKANEQLVKAIEKAHKSLIDISINDPIREQIDTLFSGRVGCCPQSQEDLDKLVQDGESRFENKIPPGFEDSKKGNNPNDANFVFNHIKYQKKFGDLILWKQLIHYVSSCDIKNVLLVTADNKADWWWREQGKTIGPHSELSREIAREGGVELFWMYSSDQFVDQAQHYTTTQINQKSVHEIREASINLDSASLQEEANLSTSMNSATINTHTFDDNDFYKNRILNPIPNESFRNTTTLCVARWLLRLGFNSIRTIPDNDLVLYASNNEGVCANYIIQCHRKDLSKDLSDLLNAIQTGVFSFKKINLIYVLTDDRHISFSERIEIKTELDLLRARQHIPRGINFIAVGVIQDMEFAVLLKF